MSILMTVLIGLVVGIFAKLLMPGRDAGGLIITTILGIAGSVLANFLGSSFGFYHAGEKAGFIASVIGAMILLGLYKIIAGRRTSTI